MFHGWGEGGMCRGIEAGKYLLLSAFDTCFPSWSCHAGLVHLVGIHTCWRVAGLVYCGIPRLNRRKKAYKKV